MCCCCCLVCVCVFASFQKNRKTTVNTFKTRRSEEKNISFTSKWIYVFCFFISSFSLLLKPKKRRYYAWISFAKLCMLCVVLIWKCHSKIVKSKSKTMGRKVLLHPQKKNKTNKAKQKKQKWNTISSVFCSQFFSSSFRLRVCLFVYLPFRLFMPKIWDALNEN